MAIKETLSREFQHQIIDLYASYAPFPKSHAADLYFSSVFLPQLMAETNRLNYIVVIQEAKQKVAQIYDLLLTLQVLLREHQGEFLGTDTLDLALLWKILEDLLVSLQEVAYTENHPFKQPVDST